MAELMEKGKTYPREYRSIGDKKVFIQHVTTTREGEKVFMAYTLDLTGITLEEIMEMAARTINIEWIRPRLFRASSAQEVINLDHETIKAADYRPESPQKLSKVEKARKAIAKLTPEERAELLEALK